MIKELRAQNQSSRLRRAAPGGNQDLRQKVRAWKTTASDDGRSYITFDAFTASAGRSYGRKLWKTAFAFEAGITIKHINAWETVGSLPPVGGEARCADRRAAQAHRSKPWTD
jgi:hypothetical protein